MDSGMNWQRFRAEPTKLSLYGYWRSSASWRVRWALMLKGIAFEYKAINLLKGENKSPEHLKKSPLGSVPVLEINSELYLTESMAIIEWIEEVYTLKGPALFPGLPVERAYIRSLCEMINSDTAALQTPAVQKRHSSDAEEQKKWAQEFISRGLKAYDLASRNCSGKFSFGDDITAADLFLIPQIYNALRYELNVAQEFPQLFKIHERALSTPAALASSPEKQIDAPSIS
jgi:maleylacetoacetate isomerase